MDKRNDTRRAIMGTKNTTVGLLGGLVALAGLPNAATAQETRSGWSPFLGCWQSESAEEAEGVLCLVASGEDVEMLTIAEGAVAYREPFTADGRARRIERDGCQGTESARFSGDGLRLYTASDVACAGEAPRRSTGIITMTGSTGWLDVRAIETNGATTVWSQRYRRTDGRVLVELGLADPAGLVDPFALRGIGFARPPITIDAVIDASRNVDGEAVKGWLVELEQEFAGLDSEDLIRMEDAGVSTAVIDVVVAVSFPEHFAVRSEEDRRDQRHGYWGSPFHYGSYYGGYGRYGYYGRYGSYGRYGGYYSPVVVTVDPTRRSGGGQVVAGKGYRGPRNTDDSGSGGRVRGGDSQGGSSSSGSTRTSTGRKAKPRGGK